MVIAANGIGGVGGDGEELVGALGGAEISAAEWANKKLKEKPHDGVQEAETGVFEVTIIHLPVILGGDVAITEVAAGADGFGLCAGNRDDEIVGGEVKMGEIELAERAEDFAEGARENLEPAGADGGVLEPGEFFGVILGGVDGGVGVETVQFQEDLLGAAGGGEPVADEGDAHYLAPRWVKTVPMVRRRMRKSRPRDQFWM